MLCHSFVLCHFVLCLGTMHYGRIQYTSSRTLWVSVNIRFKEIELQLRKKTSLTSPHLICLWTLILSFQAVYFFYSHPHYNVSHFRSSLKWTQNLTSWTNARFNTSFWNRFMHLNDSCKLNDFQAPVGTMSHEYSEYGCHYWVIWYPVSAQSSSIALIILILIVHCTIHDINSHFSTACYTNANTLRSGICHCKSVCRCLSVCKFRAPYSASWNFQQCFYAIL